MKLILRLFIHAFCLMGLGGGIIGGAIVLYLEPTLPPASEIQNIELQIPMRIYTKDQKLLGEFGEKRRTPISFDQIPQTYVNAVISAEDASFFEHIGIDFKGLTRAVVQLVTTGEIQSGGSTITMQLAKNYFLTFDQLFSRKFTEILLAFKLEQQLSKEQIFELYANKIFYGKRAYGAQAAANIYYGKNLQELSLAQQAMIAGLPKAPSTYNPIVNPDRALARRDWILNRMAKLGYINQVMLTQAQAQPLTASLHGPVVELEAPYVAEMVRSQLVDQYGSDIYTKGVSVFTTVNGELQLQAQSAIKKGLEAYDERHGYRGAEESFPLDTTVDNRRYWLDALSLHQSFNQLVPAIVTEISTQTATLLFKDGSTDVLNWENVQDTRNYITEDRRSATVADFSELFTIGDMIRVRRQGARWLLTQIPEIQGTLVSIDANDGSIQALVGGYDFYLSNFNRATQAERQPGSNFKPIIYTYAMESGYTPASIINDAPKVYDDKSQGNQWRPDNASDKFYGPTPLRVALYKSRNLVSVRLMEELGPANVAKFAENFGFRADKIPHHMSLSLGTLNASPLEVASAYTVFANGGYKVAPYIIERVIDGEGNILLEANPQVVCHNCDNENADEADDFEALGFEELLDSTSPDSDSAAADQYAPRVVDARSVYLIDSILQDTVTRGTAWRAKKLGRSDLAGKTGTTNGPTDAWFSGYVPGLVTTTWVGFDSFSNLGAREYGGTAALPIWMDYMEKALEGVPEQQRVRPSGIVSTLIDPETGLRVRAGTAGAKFELFREDNLPAFAQQGTGTSFNTIKSTAPAVVEETSLF